MNCASTHEIFMQYHVGTNPVPRYQVSLLTPTDATTLGNHEVSAPSAQLDHPNMLRHPKPNLNLHLIPSFIYFDPNIPTYTVKCTTQSP